MRFRLTTLALLCALSSAATLAPRTVRGQNPLEALKKKADEARKKVEEAKRKADSTTAAAKKKADAAISLVDSSIAPSSATPPNAAAPSAAQGAQQRPTAQPVAAGRRGAQAAPVAAAGGGAAAKAPGSSAKIEAAVLVNGEPGMQYVLSPRGQHLAAVMLRGSRTVVVHDNVDEPKFEDVVTVANSNARVIFSEDGEHWAYLAKDGDQYVVMADGKPVARGGPWLAPGSQPTVAKLGFTPGSKHVWFTTHKQPSVRDEFQLFIDGKPGPISHDAIEPLFSPDGERHTYLLATNPLQGERSQTLIIDGKPAGYLAGNMQWTADSKSLITSRTVPGVGAMEVLVDGRPVMRAAGVQVQVPPVGPGFMTVVTMPFVNSRRTVFLTVGTQKVPGSDCAGSAGWDVVMFTPDAKHWAARCQDGPTSYFVMADGKKGQTYNHVGAMAFTGDGRVVYQATMNNKQFVVTGAEESSAYTMLWAESAVNREKLRGGAAGFMPAAIAGTHVGYFGQTAAQMGRTRTFVLDGKARDVEQPGELEPSPDGSRWAIITGGQFQGVIVDGTPHTGIVLTADNRTNGWHRVVFSPDSKHIAYGARIDDGTYDRGIAIDGQYLKIGGMQDADLVAFSPDAKHLAWVGYSAGASTLGVYLDGELVIELANQNLSIRNEPAPRWAWLPDGTLSFVAQDGDAMKRFRVTPSTSTSLETMLSRAARPAK